MIRTGYLRWEIEATQKRSEQDNLANEVTLRAWPTYRKARIKWSTQSTAEQRFAQGAATYAEVLASTKVEPTNHTDIILPDVGPRSHRYALEDRDKMPRFWMEKMNRFVNTFAHELVNTSAGLFPQLVIANPILRTNYARMVEHEIHSVINGRSKPRPSNEDEVMEIDVTTHKAGGIPELVAAELVRDVFTPEHFEEFAHHNRVTIKSNDLIYRIHRRTHALVEVWNADNSPKAQLCIVFKDPGMPPSDEVVMKYLLAIHDPKTLWEVANKFPPPVKSFRDQ